MVDDPSGDDPSSKVNPTIAATEADMVPSLVSTISLPPIGYALGHVIGRGGMGEVHAAQDKRIGREVALKRMRNATPSHEAVTRFLREARTQARLDHPAICPVHELGIDEEGRPYFTMKRITGTTLARLIADGGSLQRLLRAFVDVCLAIDFAHSRGVVHRDLKPANVMLGDYGEVYVLDWGVARWLMEQTDPETFDPVSAQPAVGPDDSTKSGALLGTPGYIPPEQIQGAPAAAPADVYSLGAILFEILAAEPLHPRGQSAIGRTLSAPQASPAQRRPDRHVPPELDVICYLALSDSPADRPSAREIANKIQAYLDGDRDLERRQQLAQQQLASAREALASDAPDGRATAMRRAGRALALDPESTDAGEMVGALLLEPPAKLPLELDAALAAEEARQSTERNRQAVIAYLSIFTLLPLALLLEIKSYRLLFGFYALIAIGALFSWRHAQRGRASIPVILVSNIALALLFTRIAGPFILTPLFICGVLVSITSNPWLIKRMWAVIAWTTIAVMLPIVLERVGLLNLSWSIGDGAMLVVSDMFHTYGRAEEVALVIANLSFTVTVGLVALSIARGRSTAQRALLVQAWHLRQLLPTARRWATNLR